MFDGDEVSRGVVSGVMFASNIVTTAHSFPAFSAITAKWGSVVAAVSLHDDPPHCQNTSTVLQHPAYQGQCLLNFQLASSGRRELAGQGCVVGHTTVPLH